MTQLPLNFDGESYDKARDSKRLGGQLERVKVAMRGGVWRTLEQIADITGDSDASVSARLRDLRKPKFGGHTVERRYVRDGLFEYRVGDL